METIIFIAFFVGFLLLVIRFTWIFKDESFPYELQKIRHKNTSKHACKCYMEGLTFGEQKVADILAGELSYKDYFLFNNIIINSKNNVSTQIDHIVVSKFGIFVIESKDLNGWIFGSRNAFTWTQSMPGAVKYKFQNPIRQNYGHLMALKELMPFAKDNFYSIVVFTGSAEIKTERIDNVLYLSELIECIKKYNQEKLNENEVQFAVGKLSYACQTINITVDEHVSNIHANKNYQERSRFNPQPFSAFYNRNKNYRSTVDKNPARTAYIYK